MNFNVKSCALSTKFSNQFFFNNFLDSRTHGLVRKPDQIYISNKVITRSIICYAPVLPRGECSPPGKFRQEKYQKGDQGKNRQKFTPPPPRKFRREKSQR
jgi:hypothetical protein